MASFNSNEPAMPTGRTEDEYVSVGGDIVAVKNGKASSGGLTKREYIAAMAMQGMLSNHYNRRFAELTAKNAVKYADELLEELEK